MSALEDTDMRSIVQAAVMALMLASTASAHHSLALFDTKTVVTLQGKITRVEWKSPHTMIFIDAKQPSGQVAEWKDVAEWRIETVPNSWLMGNGWTKESLQAGENVTVEVYSYTDKAERYSFLLSVTKPDGTKLMSPLNLARTRRTEN
jgi:hypothetical protein